MAPGPGETPAGARLHEDGGRARAGRADDRAPPAAANEIARRARVTVLTRARCGSRARRKRGGHSGNGSGGTDAHMRGYADGPPARRCSARGAHHGAATVAEELRWRPPPTEEPIRKEPRPGSRG